MLDLYALIALRGINIFERTISVTSRQFLLHTKEVIVASLDIGGGGKPMLRLIGATL